MTRQELLEHRAKLARERREKKHNLKLKENLEKKRKPTFPENTDYEKPFTKVDDGFGYIGVLLCDKYTGQVQCHLCGGWFDWLNNHITGYHKIKTNEYKEKFGLKYNTALCSEKVRDMLVRRAMTFPWERMKRLGLKLGRFAKSGSIHRSKKWRLHNARANEEEKNEHGTCDLQIIDKLMKASSKLGRQPNSREMETGKIGVNRGTIIKRFGSVKEVRRILELQGFRYDVKSGIKAKDDEMLEALRKFNSVYKRRPTISDIDRGLIPYSSSAYIDHFGKWSHAISKAFGEEYFMYQNSL